MSETGSNTSQVFVSYSRKDSTFLRKLYAALEQRGFSVWVDWEDIPPSTNFREEILPGIDASENFIFVISPDSIESVVCAWELEHAVQQNKRLFPVVVRTTFAERVPDAVRDLQWMFFRDEDPFDTAFEQLVWALETDLEYARTHTRLLTRAEEWQSADRRSSLLLRGKDLKQAEDWLLRGTDAAQRPTTLQEAYITESRRGSKRRRRFLLYGIASGLLISFLAVWFYRDADDRLRFTNARDLAVKAQGLLRERDGLRRGMLLGLESLTRYRTQEADALLRNGLSLLPRRVFSVDTDHVQNLVLSPSGDYLAVQHSDRFRLWYLPARYMMREWPVRASFHAAKPGLMLSRDGTRLARARDTRTVEVVGLEDGALLYAWTHDRGLRSVVLSPDGSTLFTIDGEGALHAHDIGSRERKTKGLRAELMTMAVNPDGSLLALADSENRIHLYDPAAAETTQLLPHDAPPIEIGFTGDGRLFTRTDKGVTRVWATKTGEELAFIRSGGTGVVSSIRSGGAEVYTLLANGELDIRDLGSGTRISNLDLTPESRFGYRLGRMVVNIQFVQLKTASLALDQHRFAFINPAVSDSTKQGDRVDVWEFPKTAHVRMALLESRNVPGAVAFSSDGSRLLVMGLDGKVRILDARSLEERHEVSEGTAVIAADLSPDGRWLATATLAGKVLIRDLQKSGNAVTIEGHWPVGALGFLDQGRRVVVAAADRTIRVWSVPGGELLHRLPHHGDFRMVEISADRRFLVAAGKSGLHRVDLERMTVDHSYYSGAPETEHFVTKEVELMAVAISGDGERIATTGNDNVIRIYGAALPIPLMKFSREHLDNELALSRDGRFLAAGDTTGRITVWDLEGGREVLRVDAASKQPFTFLDLAFSPDNRQLLAASTEGLKRVHPYAPDDLIEAVCTILPRNWEMAEWRRYFGNRPYRPACALSPLQEEVLVRRSTEFRRLKWTASRYPDSSDSLFRIR